MLHKQHSMMSSEVATKGKCHSLHAHKAKEEGLVSPERAPLLDLARVIPEGGAQFTRARHI